MTALGVRYRSSRERERQDAATAARSTCLQRSREER